NETNVIPSRSGTKSISLLIMYRVITNPACYNITIKPMLSTGLPVKNNFRAFVHCIDWVDFIPAHPRLLYEILSSVPEKYRGNIFYYQFLGLPVIIISVGLIKRKLSPF